MALIYAHISKYQWVIIYDVIPGAAMELIRKTMTSVNITNFI